MELYYNYTTMVAIVVIFCLNAMIVVRFTTTVIMLFAIESMPVVWPWGYIGDIFSPQILSWEL
jgi:hypothetical protein